MKLTGINGSPRGKTGNSAVFLQSFLDGYTDATGHASELVHLKQLNAEEQQRLFSSSEILFIAFPLYADSMPALVKYFIEKINLENKPKAIGFIIQSGFPEALHLRNLEKYCNKLGLKLGQQFVGTIVKGSGELIRIPKHMSGFWGRLVYWLAISTNIGGIGYMLDTERQKNRFYKLGKSFGITGKLDKKMLKIIARPERISKFAYLLFRIVGERFYWDSLLQKNRVYEKRHEQPDLPK